MTAEQEKTISQELEDLLHARATLSIKLADIVHQLRERGFGMLMMVLVLPNCVPIPVPPGVSTVFSIPLLFLTIQMIWGRPEPWIPHKLAEKEITLTYLRAVLARILRYLHRLEAFVRPRWLLVSSATGERILGICWFAFAVSIAIPLPMTNFLPGIGILISAFGLLNRDGLVVFAGLAVGILGLALTTALLMLGTDVVFRIIHFL
jgi:hypothetical protein